MHPHVVLFDLDGTLTESGPGIMRSVAFALEAVGAPALEADALLRFLGPPLAESFRQIAALDDAEVEAALAAFAQYFHRRGMFENSVYPGVSELLHALNGAGRRLGVATSKRRRPRLPSSNTSP
jgi:phosphoglycolate phosphatase